MVNRKAKMRQIRSDQIEYTKPPVEEYLREYNDLLASFLVRHFPSFKYLASSTLNRLEGQTHFFEKVEKYLQIRDVLSNDAELVIRLIDNDVFLYEILEHEFGERVMSDQEETIRKWQFAVKYMLHFGYNFVLSIFCWLLVKTNKKYDYVIRSYFDFRNVGNKLREEYFGPFADDLAEDYSTLIIYKLIHRNDLFQYLRIRNTASFDTCLLESFLRPWTVIKVFLRCLASYITLDQRIFYKGYDITLLLQKSLDDDYYSMRGLGVYLEYEAAKRIFDLIPKRIMFPYENQTWEKVYPLVRNKVKDKVSILGFQHTGVSYKLLNYFPSSIEMHLPVFPDKIVTVGNILKQILKDRAYYPCEIVAGAALRHTKFIEHGRFPIKSQDSIIKWKIVYAFSYDVAKYRAIIGILKEVFAESDIVIYLKFHPDYNEEEIIGLLGCALPANFVPAQSIPWDDIYRTIDLILYDDNSIGLEGMINGVKTLMVDIGEPIYNCERLFYFTSWKTVVDKDGLLQIRKELEDGTFIKEFPEEVSDYVNQYYKAYSKGSCFRTYIN